MNMIPAIDIQDITVSYRESVALYSLSLKIHEGEFVGIAGPNGAGKTTLLTAINGLGKLLKGSVHIFGIRMNVRGAVTLRKEIGYVPQIINIDPRMPMRVKEVVMLGRFGKIGLFKRPALEDRQIVEEVADLVGIKNLLSRPIGHLSGGEQRKVAIARALAQQPRILLLDEPFSNLDMNAQFGILNLIDKVHQQKHLTTVMVMHQLALIPKSCSRMILLKNSRVIFDGAISEVLDEKILSQLYDCPIRINKHNYGINYYPL